MDSTFFFLFSTTDTEFNFKMLTYLNPFTFLFTTFFVDMRLQVHFDSLQLFPTFEDFGLLEYEKILSLAS